MRVNVRGAPQAHKRMTSFKAHVPGGCICLVRTACWKLRAPRRHPGMSRFPSRTISARAPDHAGAERRGVAPGCPLGGGAGAASGALRGHAAQRAESAGRTATKSRFDVLFIEPMITERRAVARVLTDRKSGAGDPAGQQDGRERTRRTPGTQMNDFLQSARAGRLHLLVMRHFPSRVRAAPRVHMGCHHEVPTSPRGRLHRCGAARTPTGSPNPAREGRGVPTSQCLCTVAGTAGAPTSADHPGSPEPIAARALPATNSTSLQVCAPRRSYESHTATSFSTSSCLPWCRITSIGPACTSFRKSSHPNTPYVPAA